MTDPQKLLRIVLGACIVSTAIHYTDNLLNVEQFPDPQIDGVVVVLSWLGFTALGLVAYRLYVRERFAAAHACLAIYSLVGLSSLGHYAYGVPEGFPRNLSVLTDALTGAAVLAFAIWSATHGQAAAQRGAVAGDVRSR